MTRPTPPDASNILLQNGTIRVLLIDDQPMIAEAVRRMLATESGVEFHYCQEPQRAIVMANEIKPTVILQDLVMPEIDGQMLVKFFRANPATVDTPLIVLSSKEEGITKAEAFANGANDYLVKLPDKIELLARIRYHSRAYVNLVQRNAAYKEIETGRKKLADEMAAGEKYVRSLLPRPWKPGDDPDIDAINWYFVPTAAMGGDALGYHRLDKDHLAMYLLDITGHGLDSALYGVTVLNVLRTGTLSNTDFKKPGEVLFALNEAFPCEKHGEKFFTIWYGVFNCATRKLTWAGAGHPASFLYTGSGPNRPEPQQLDSQGPMIGMMPWPEFEQTEVDVPPNSWLYLYSDGAHEIHKADGTDWTIPEFIQTFTDLVNHKPNDVMPELHRLIRNMNGSDVLDDDLSILEIRFP